MKSRQRVRETVNLRPPDRIPVDFWAVEEVFADLQEALGISDREGVLRWAGADLRYFRGSGAGPEPASEDTEEGFTDHWGVRRKWHTVTGRRKDGQAYTWRYKHMVASPLADAETTAEIERHAWPDPSRWDYSHVKDACRAIRRAGRAVVFGGDRLDRTAQLKAGMYLRGMERFVEDLILRPALAECVLAHVAEYYLQYNRRVLEAAEGAVDIFFMGDDMGTQDSTWVSPEMYRRFFKDRFGRFNELAHGFGAKTMYHTCGRVTSLVGEFVDAGLDILQSLQPAAMGDDLANLKRDYGRRLCFQGGIDIQGVLPRGTPAEVRQHVCGLAETMGQDGGYIFGTAHNILPDTPLENIVALVDAYREFGGCA